MAISFKPEQAFWNNPVVVRDMRVKLRGSRTFWNMAFYLGILLVISLMGYRMATVMGGNLDPVTIQLQLQAFYYAIFETLAFLVCVIAPALTAVTMVSERQRLTLDLLVTTPMTSMQMLGGKLISSLAFLGLLFALSAPVSALCVILGGATLADIARTYAILMVDGLVFAAIGLAFSCSVKNNSQAITHTYATIVGILIATSMVFPSLYSGMYSHMGMRAASATAPLCVALIGINPLLSTMPQNSTVDLFGLQTPAWIVTMAFAAVLIRLILTGAALRLGLYGPNLVASLRRQLILGAFLSGIVLYGLHLDPITLVKVTASTVFVIALFNLPALFVPAVDEDGAGDEVVAGSYVPRSAFSGKHAGALPYFHLCLLALIAGIALCQIMEMTTVARMSLDTDKDTFLADIALAFYFSGLGFLVWSLARRASWMTTTTDAARTMTFVVFVFIILVPAAVMLSQSTLQVGGSVFDRSPWRYAWLLYPYTESFLAFYWSGALAYGLGVLIYPFWRSVTPGAGARRAAVREAK